MGGGHHGRKLSEHLLEVADERDVDADIFVDLRGIDFDVDLFGSGRVVRKVSGDAIVEAHAEGE